MKYFIGPAKAKVADVSYSAEMSEKMWVGEISARPIYQDERVDVYSDNSPDSWNSRFGFQVRIKPQQGKRYAPGGYPKSWRGFNLHFTGKGIAWGYATTNRGMCPIIGLPEELCAPGRSVIKEIRKNGWVPVNLPDFHGDAPQAVPMVANCYW